MPAPEVEAWAKETFIKGTGPLLNPDHRHLEFAELGFLWTNVGNSRQGRNTLGTAEIQMFKGNRWQKERQARQMEDWFVDVPDFVITLYAPFAAAADNATFCALVEHELLHCAQKLDEFNCPKFHQQTGEPLFAIRGHDVSEFIWLSGQGQLIETEPENNCRTYKFTGRLLYVLQVEKDIAP
jgi:hypothetical protein